VKHTLKLSGFIVIFLGTVGLVVTEVFTRFGGTAFWQYLTLTFALVNVLGFILLAFSHWCIRQDK